MVTEKGVSKKNSLVLSILDTEVHSTKECKLPVILDKDPVFAANFLTIKDSEEVLELMLTTFKSIKSRRSKYKLAEVLVMWSFTNFNWFVKYTEELIRLVLGESRKFKFPMDLCPQIDPRSPKDGHSRPFFCPPVKYNSGKHRAELIEFRVKNLDPIDCYRVQYISNNYYLEDFREGYPGWYSLSDVVVYENYNPRTNNRIRIVHRNGEYSYYITGASDNWKEIVDVPIEMDYVISALLFRN